jgi:4-hydroxy-3-polyprenylbenzoate decarboxylase
VPFDTLTDYLTSLEDDRELVRVPVEVDLRYELTAIVERVSRQPGGGPALLFEKTPGRAIPVAANLLGSARRICRVLNCESLDDAGGRMAALVEPQLPQGWMEVLRLVPQFAQLVRLPPRTVKSGICQQVVRMGGDVNLADLPIPHGRPQEAAPTVTMGQVYSRDPQSGVRHAALTPLAVRGRGQLAVHWTAHDVGWQHYTAWRRLRQPMPAAVALGGDPLLAFAACCPLPANTDPLLLAGFLRDRNVDVVKCRSLELEVPAGAEIVIEGMIDTTQPLERSGPLALDTGFCGALEDVPFMQVTALTHRSNPVFPIMVQSAPPCERTWIERAIERLFVPLVRLAVPEVVDLHRPSAAGGRLAFVSIRKHYAGQARKVLHALWGLGWLMTTKLIVVVDADVNVHDTDAVWFHVGANAHPGRDAVFCEGPTAMDDHAAPIRGLGHKLGLDASRKLPEEGHPRPWPEPLETPHEIRSLVEHRWREYGLT